MGNLIYIFTDGKTEYEYTIPKGWLIAIIALIIVFTIGFYVLRSIGVYKLSKKSGFKYAFLAWIPCVWIYPACRLLGDVIIFGKKMKGFASFSLAVMSVLFAIQIANAVLVDVPLAIHILNGGDIKMSAEAILYPSFNDGVVKAYDILGTISGIVSLFEIFVTVTMYFNIFKKYWPQRYVMASILSVFGLFPIFVFVIRNKQPVDYNEWARARYNAYFMNNPYANPYQQPPQSQPSNQTPFAEFDDAKTPVDPFEEFSDKKDD